ncbi:MULTISPECIES: hypothetical protein [Cupriavidus]
MGIFRSAGRFAVRQTLHLGYATHIVAGARLVQENWRRVSARICPSCQSGRLHAFEEPIDGRQRAFRGCDTCDYYEAGNVAQDNDSLARLHAISDERLREMGDEVEVQIRKFLRLSRIWYSLAVLMVLTAVVLVALQWFGLTFVYLLLFGMNLAVHGMAASYRHWQLKHRQLYVKGAFRQWLRTGEWII